MNTILKTHFSIANLNGNSFNMIPISTQEVEIIHMDGAMLTISWTSKGCYFN
jgi:hypothetical protein